MYDRYLHKVMIQLSNILHNASQSNSSHHSKDVILNNLKDMINEYNLNVNSDLKVSCTDFRDKNNV